MARWRRQARPGESLAAHAPDARSVLLLSLGDAYVDLATVADLAALNELGFFAAGLVLHGPDGHDHLRLQLLDSEEIELDDVVCDPSFAQSLRRRVLVDKARVGG